MFIRGAAEDFPYLNDNLPQAVRDEMAVPFSRGNLWEAAVILNRYGHELKHKAEQAEDDVTLAVARRLIEIAGRWHTCFNPGV